MPRSSPWLFGLFLVGCGVAADDGEPPDVAAVADELTTPGTTAWSYRVAGPSAQEATGVARAPENGVYVAGNSWDDLYYRGPRLTVQTASGSTGYPHVFTNTLLTQTRAFVVRLGANTGSTVWVRDVGTEESSGYVLTRDMVATDNRRLVVVGSFDGTVFFDEDRALVGNEGDGFVWRLFP